MQNISSTSLFHFTSSFENIIGILENGFEHRPVKEVLPLSNPKSDFDFPDLIKHEFVFKAVCFCDIPLRYIKNHTNQYGKYAIALTKNWGILNNITPIRYVHFHTPDLRDSTFSLIQDIAQNEDQTLNKVLRVLQQSGIGKISTQDFKELPEKIVHLINLYNELLSTVCKHTYKHYGLMRRYEDLHRKDSNDDSFDSVKCFYDEREWRSLDNGNKGNLTFEANSISKIIVENRNQRQKLLNFFQEESDRFSLSSISEIAHKIFIYEELMKDI